MKTQGSFFGQGRCITETRRHEQEPPRLRKGWGLGGCIELTSSKRALRMAFHILECFQNMHSGGHRKHIMQQRQTNTHSK